MRVVLPFIGASLLIGGSAAAEEQYEQGPYVGISAGYLGVSDVDATVGATDVEVEFDDGFDVGVQIGYKQWVWRLEAEFEYASSEFDGGGDFGAYRWTGSLYYDYDAIVTKFVPYFGAGIGVAYVDADDATVGAVNVDVDSDTYFTAHAEVGASLWLNFDLDLVPSYRFIYLDSGGNGVDDTTAHLFKIGLRHAF